MSTPSQTKGFQPRELITAKKQLEEQVKSDFPSMIGLSHHTPPANMLKENSISIELYRLRYPVYTAFKKFVLSILRDASVSNDDISQFIKGTEDALFLFGAEIEEYLETVYKQAVQIRQVQRIIHRGSGTSAIDWDEALELDQELFSWFEKQLNDGKYVFARYLNVTR